MALTNSNGRTNQQANSQQIVKGVVVYTNRLPN